jgi:DNA modification methylase
MKSYDQSRRAISIDFRKEARTLHKVDRGRHYIHSYPAKLLPEIPKLFLSTELFSRPGDLVLDPFCGTGTVLLEAIRHDRKAAGADSNPLARLIAITKLGDVSEQGVRAELGKLRRSVKGRTPKDYPDVINMDYWFHPHIKLQLQQLLGSIHSVKNRKIRNYLTTCFSQCVRAVSKADPRLSVPVRLRQDQYPDGHPLAAKTKARIAALRKQNVLSCFLRIAETNLPYFTNEKIRGSASISNDARSISRVIKKESVQLVLTSPPYLGAQKYIRACSLSLGWLGLVASDELKCFEAQSIGREHFSRVVCKSLPATGLSSADRRIRKAARINPLRGKIAAEYLAEMREVLQELHFVLKPGGFLIFVIGNNHLCGAPFSTERYLRKLAEINGFETRLRLVDNIKSRGLMTKRNKTANVISREWVLILQKPE